MKKILVIGSSCVDVIIKVDHLPKRGEDIEPEYQKMLPGGCAHNVAYVIKACGGDVSFLTPVGGGVYGDYMWKHLKKEGFKGPIRIGGENGCCYCLVDSTGERTFLSLHGVEYSFHESYMAEIDKNNFDYTYICGLEIEEETGEELIDYLKKQSTEVFYAPGSRIKAIPFGRHEEILNLRPVLHLNEGEALYLAGEILGDKVNDVEAAGNVIYKRSCNVLIITRGDKGSLWWDEKGNINAIKCEEAKVRDTIGAGDSHAGGVLAGISLGYDMKESMELAGRIAKGVVEAEGAQICEEKIKEMLNFGR